jgi:AmmeMemoRadiSam system protein B
MLRATSGSTNKTRFAGSWYPRSPDALTRILEDAVAGVGTVTRDLRGAILPHAGLAFSATGMAEGFARVPTGDVEQIVLFAPSHYVRLASDTLYSAAFSSHETPIGSIPGLAPPTDMADAADAVEQEHAVELLLPFIRHTLPEVPLLAVLVPEIRSLEQTNTLVDTLLGSMGKDAHRTLFLASSDFTHYGTRFRYTPYGTSPLSDVAARVEADDRAFATAAAQRDAGRAFARIADKPISVCGRYPILLLTVLMERLGATGELSRYYTSNDVHTPSEDFVCYASVIYHARESK